MLGTMIGVALASTVLMAIVVTGSINAAYYSLDTRLSGLLLGSAMAFFFAPYQIRGRPGRGVRARDGRRRACSAWSCCCGAFHHFTYPFLPSGDLSVFRGGFLLVDIATLFVIAAVVHPRSDAGPMLGCAPLRWIGVRSYSLYLWHYPIFCVTRPGLDVPLHGWPLAVLRLVLSFGAADLSYRFVETPMRGGAIGRYLDRMRIGARAAARAKSLRGAIVSRRRRRSSWWSALGASLAARTGHRREDPGRERRGRAQRQGQRRRTHRRSSRSRSTHTRPPRRCTRRRRSRRAGTTTGTTVPGKTGGATTTPTTQPKPLPPRSSRSATR